MLFFKNHIKSILSDLQYLFIILAVVVAKLYQQTLHVNYKTLKKTKHHGSSRFKDYEQLSMQYTFVGKLHIILNGISIKIFRLSNELAERCEYFRLYYNLIIKAIKFVLKLYLLQITKR